MLNFREYLLNIDPLAAGWGITAEDRLYDFRPFSLELGADFRRADHRQPRRDPGSRRKILGQPFFPASARSRRDHRRRQSDDDQYSAQQRTERESRQLPKLRFVTSSSAPLLVEEWKRFEQKFGIAVAQGCGASEASWIAAIPGEERRLGTVGKPFAYHDLAIVDADGRRLPPGEIGYVELGGWPDHPFRYLGDDGEIKIHSRGRFRTGDLGCLDADGFLMLTGREKEQIIRGGAKISPVEIDSYLMQRADVIEAATVGVPDAVYGEEVVSYVVTRPGTPVDADELLRYCATVLPAFKAPKQIVISASLPKTERGKLDRKALAQIWKSSLR